jgi:hypothetical protein
LVSQEASQRFGSTVLAPLVRVEYVVVLSSFNELSAVKGCGDQLSPHTVIKDQAQYLSVPVIEHEATPHFAAVCQPKLKDIRKDYLG